MRGVHLAHYFNAPTVGSTRSPAPITAFLYPGCGFGGSCLPKDVKALVAHGEAIGQPMRLLGSVIDINLDQPQRMLAILDRHFPSLQGLRVSVLGLAFKPDTDDVRESPAIPVIRDLIGRGAVVSAYDPVATSSAKKVLPENRVRFLDTLESALKEVDAVLLITRWDEFRRIPELLAGVENAPLFVDGRRMLDKRQFARYDGIGL
jgi:UDPglucose 6-dehydrogenase